MISDQIIIKYESNLEKLPTQKRLHWLIRRYRVTGSLKYIPLIKTTYKELLLAMKKILGAFTGDEKIINIGKKKLAGYRSTSPRKIRRIAYYRKSPEVQVYMEGILYMFFIKSLGLQNSPDISKEFKMAESYIEKKDVGKIFVDSGFLTINPSASANMIYYLSFLGLSDYRRELQKRSEDYWLKISPNDLSTWLNKVYALTHIIIAASNYYQDFVSKKEYEWIFNYFEDDYKNILSKANADSIGEVGLCFKLAGDYNNPIVKIIQEYLVSKFDKKLGYIPNDRNPTIITSEHRNVIATMVLEDFERLYKGPIYAVLYIIREYIQYSNVCEKFNDIQHQIYPEAILGHKKSLDFSRDNLLST